MKCTATAPPALRWARLSLPSTNMRNALLGCKCPTIQQKNCHVGSLRLSPDSSINLQIENFDCTSTHEDHDHHQQLRNSIAQKFLNSLKKNEALYNTHPPKHSKFADLLNLSLSHRDVNTQVINNTPKFNSLLSRVNFHEHPLDLWLPKVRSVLQILEQTLNFLKLFWVFFLGVRVGFFPIHFAEKRKNFLVQNFLFLQQLVKKLKRAKDLWSHGPYVLLLPRVFGFCFSGIWLMVT